MPSSRLIPITYYNASKEIRISAYADLIIIEPAKPEPILRCIRFGGYPEMVQAMYDSIYAGATIEARIGDATRRFSSEPKRFIRQISRDGVYAEATLLAKDDDEAQRPNHATKENTGRTDENELQSVNSRFVLSNSLSSTVSACILLPPVRLQLASTRQEQ
jgi:hypothetical protein